MIIITFAKNWRGYAAGETAGFVEALAKGLIASGHAEAATKTGASSKRGGRAPSKLAAAAPSSGPVVDTPPPEIDDDEKP